MLGRNVASEDDAWIASEVAVRSTCGSWVTVGESQCGIAALGPSSQTNLVTRATVASIATKYVTYPATMRGAFWTYHSFQMSLPSP